MNILITLCARKGSKGVPGKNSKLLNGKPLIVYSIEAARKFSEHYTSDLSLSTDDTGIKKIAEDSGLRTDYIRPDFLATDSAGKVEVIEALLIYEEKTRNKKYDFILDLDISAPLRTTDDLLNAFKLMLKDDSAFNLFSVSPAHRNPYFNMVEEGKDGYYKLIKNQESYTTRQASPKVYDLNASFYIYRRSFFDQKFRSVFTDKSLAYVLPHICFDIDEPVDFDMMEFLISSNKLGFKL